MRVRMRRSAEAGKVPTTVQLELGELAVNTYDGRLFLKRDDGTEAIVEIVNAGRLISAGTGLTGGGSLAADRTLAADFASQLEAEAGIATDKVMTPLRVAQAIAELGGAPEDLTAGETIRSRLDAYDEYTSPVWAVRYSFDFAQNGTIRVSFDYSSSSGETARFAVNRLRNGGEASLAQWVANSTAWQTASLDVDVVPGDRINIYRLATNYSVQEGKETIFYRGYARMRNIRFKTGGEKLVPGIYARVENS